jgi:hypothetical protein
VKTKRRALEDQEIRDMVAYYAKCQSLRDFIDEKVVPSNFHFQKIKQYSNLLVKELEAQVDYLFKQNDKDTAEELVHHFIDASQQADYLYEIALKLELLEEDKKIECATRVSTIFREYGVEK